MNILALCGLRKAGKTTSACVLKEIDNRFKIVSLADPLKESFADYIQIPRSYLDSSDVKEKYRRELQLFSWQFKEKNPNYFVDLLFAENAAEQCVVIDDLRFSNELEAVLKRGGTVYQVYADPYVRKSRGWLFNRDVDTDVSELELGSLSSQTMLALGGGLIWNNGSRESLRPQLYDILAKHFMNKLLS
jgi:phosphomevalonate kinase